MRKLRLPAALLSVSIAAAGSPAWAADTLRLLTWGSYAPEDVIEMFKQETGYRRWRSLSRTTRR